MRLLAVDGNSIMNRAFYGVKMLTNKKGQFTNALVGFMNIFLKAVEEIQPDHLAVAFDLHAPTFRHKADASYKATRKGMPAELREQMPRIKELLTALGVPILEKEGFEADDILGTLARIFSSQDGEAVLLTGDRDSLQLISPGVTVLLATNREQIPYTPERFAADYDGLAPKQLIDLKALMGDPSDNISGVAGIGEKTARQLIVRFHSVEELYEQAAASDLRPTLKNKLLAGQEAAKQSKWLATIVTNVPLQEDAAAYLPSERDESAAAALLSEWEMFSLMDRLHIDIHAAREPKGGQGPSSVEKKEAPLFPAELTPAEEAFWSGENNRVCFLWNASGPEAGLLLCQGESLLFLPLTEEETILRFLSSPCQKATIGAKPAYLYAMSRGSSVANLCFDGELAAYLLTSTPQDSSMERLCGSFQSPFRMDVEEKWREIASVEPLCQKLEQAIQEARMASLLTEMEQPLTEVLASMETAGVLIDTEGVRTFGVQLRSEMDGLEQDIYQMAGRSFNIGSPKQLAVILFEELHLPPKKKTKSGYSTNAEVLEGLRDQHPIVDLILQYRQLSKLASTYVDGLIKAVGKDGRIHSNFKQTETRTGRISSTDPNMQNIPVRTELGSSMRKFFITSPGKVLLDADYSQIELRIVASLCGDQTMQEAFRTGEDVHTITASQVFGLPPEMVTPSMRRAAKAVNFGIIYGIGAFSLSKDIGVSVPEADQYIREYLKHYPNVERYMEETVQKAVQDGYVTTLFGRRRYIPELAASNRVQQAFGRRAAMNAPIQGTAADVIKVAMVRAYRRLKEETPTARLILQVHDELIVEVPERDADRAAEILQQEMESAVKLDVPLTAEVGRGRSWYEAKGE